jgi:hypothetical protein
VVFADARQLFVPGTIKKLVRHFCDPHVGAGSGELILTKPMNAPMVGVDIYWELEKLLRKAESKFSCMMFTYNCDVLFPGGAHNISWFLN